MLRRLLQFVGTSLAALASCYLGFLAARLLGSAPQLLLAAVTDGQVVAFGRREGFHVAPSFFVLPPSRMPVLAAAVYAAGGVILSLSLLLAAASFVRGRMGWLYLFRLFTVFWLGVVLAGATLIFGFRGSGPLADLLQVLAGESPGALAWRWIIAAIAWLAILLCLTLALRRFAAALAATFARRLFAITLWFVLPVAALSLVLSGLDRTIWFWRVSAAAGPPLVAALVALCAAWAGRNSPAAPFRPQPRGAAVTALGAVVCLAAVAAYPAMARYIERPRLETRTFGPWRVSFEQGALTPEQQKAWGEAAVARLNDYRRRLGIPSDDSHFEACVFRSTQAMRAAAGETGDDLPFVLQREPLVLHSLLAPDGAADDPRGDALLLMAAAWGQGNEPVAGALARYAAGNFLGHPLPEYARRSACEERPYSLREVLAVSPDYLSPLLRDAMSGAWVESLVEERGVAVLPQLYRAAPPAQDPQAFATVLGAEWNELEARWQRYLAPEGPCSPARQPPRTPGERRIENHRGIALSHEIGGDWGYGSDSTQRELQKIRRLGANSVAIIPYAFTGAPSDTSIRFRTDETDARVMRTIRQAKQAGLGVMLKPHLWGRDFTGDIRFESEQDFQSWWSRYRSWLLHFARMADLYGVELLAIGNELGGMTGHEQAWRDLIHDIRRVYGGDLTYASHWDGEFERVAFWDELDLIGVNGYFPLAAPGELPRSDSDRVARVQSRLEAVSRRFNKPVLFTEVGFPSTTNAAVEPWADRNAATDLVMQQRCYEVIFEALSPQPWFAGMYWWKWPSHGRGGAYDLSHYPNGKPAMEVLRHWFGTESPISKEESGSPTK